MTRKTKNIKIYKENKEFEFYSDSESEEENNNEPESRKLKWGTIIPRIGGISIGCYKSTGNNFMSICNF